MCHHNASISGHIDVHTPLMQVLNLCQLLASQQNRIIASLQPQSDMYFPIWQAYYRNHPEETGYASSQGAFAVKFVHVNWWIEQKLLQGGIYT